MLIKLISVKQRLYLLIPQHQHVVFNVLVNRVLWNLLLVLLVVLLNALMNKWKKVPPARMGLWFASLTSCTSLRHGAMGVIWVIRCHWRPSGLMGCGLVTILLRKFTLLMKSAAYTLHLLGRSYMRIPACLARIWSLISLRFFPT